MRAFGLSFVLLTLVACGDDSSPTLDGGLADGGTDAFVAMDGGADAFVAMDAGEDAFVPDDAEVPDDAGTDAAAPDATMVPGFGTIVGTCGRVAPALDVEVPNLFVVRFDFAADPYDMSDFDRLTAGARQILSEGTAGGSSALSEALSYEVLERCEGAAFVASETTVVYEPPTSKKTDIVVDIDEVVGVSVVRAFRFPGDVPYTVEDATPVLEGKLDDILVSTMNAVDPTWDRQLLVVVAWDDTAAESVMSAWASLDAATRADTIVYVVITDGMDRNVYITSG